MGELKMTLWLMRAGSHGEYEQKFISEKRIYLTWEGLNHNLEKISERSKLRSLLATVYPNAKKGCINNHAGQIWAFSKSMKPGDWVVLPSKLKRAIHIAEIAGEYCFDGKQDDPYYHYRKIKWIETDIPRSNFDQDLLYSFGSAMTICEISRNDAEKRVRAMEKSGWKSRHASTHKPIDEEFTGEPEDGTLDLEEVARDHIASLIIAKFKGHGMARLVDGILRAQGYTTFVSPEGPDKGVDILAAPEPLGFGEPRICVQVKSGDGPLDRPTLDQLIGAMQNLHAQQGLLVSWGGFKTSIERETANQFFKVRLWDQNELIEQLLEHYDKLDDDIRAELSLKRIWVVAKPAVEDE
jgi:restriction system protein